MAATIHDATLEDAAYVGARLRYIDELECMMALGLRGPEAVPLCLSVSNLAWSVRDEEGDPFVVVGVAPMAPGVGSLWSLGTDAFDERRRDMATLTPVILERCHAAYPSLVVQIADINTESARFLKRFGFEPFPLMDLPDSPFHHLVRIAHV